jgi:hydrogenase nickel incorporation protein HypA/HybF
MHELGLCRGVLETVERRAEGRPVAAVGLRVGTLHRVHPGAFEQIFLQAAAGSVAEGADVELVVVPVQGWCRDCAAGFATSEQLPICPTCGGTAVRLTGGDELLVEWIRFRDEPEG